MMNDPLTWSPINLGRWGGAQVRVHISLILFVVITLLGGLGKEPRVGEAACAVVLFLLALRRA